MDAYPGAIATFGSSTFNLTPCRWQFLVEKVVQISKSDAASASGRGIYWKI